MIAIGIIVASPSSENWQHNGARAWVYLRQATSSCVGTLCYVATWIPLVLAPGFLPFQAIYVLLFIMGVMLQSSLVFGIVKDLFRYNVSGFASGLVNIICVLGG